MTCGNKMLSVANSGYTWTTFKSPDFKGYFFCFSFIPIINWWVFHSVCCALSPSYHTQQMAASAWARFYGLFLPYTIQHCEVSVVVICHCMMKIIMSMMKLNWKWNEPNWTQFISAEKHLSAWLCLQHRKEHRTNKVQVNGDIWNEAAYSSKHWHACHICFCSLAFKLLLLILKVFPFSCPYLLLLLHCQRSLQIYLSKVGMTKGAWQMRGSGNERVLLNALWI